MNPHDRVRVTITYRDGTTVNHDLPTSANPHEDPNTKEIVVTIAGKEIRYPEPDGYDFVWYTETRRVYGGTQTFMDWVRRDGAPLE